MKNDISTVWLRVAVCLGILGGVISLFAAEANVKVEVIRLDGLVPDLPIKLRESWNSIGIDPNDNVYCVFGGQTANASDCALFQYNVKTGKPRLLGTFSQALAAVGNLATNEPIPKGHTQLPFINGKLYIGTMGFHDAINLGSGQMVEAQNTRGAHLLAYDPAAGKLEDLSANQPGGVFFKGQGFIALNKVPGTHLLAALTVPNGDLLLYDTEKNKTISVVKGVPEELGNYVGRDVVVASESKAYFSYHTANPGRGRQGGAKPPGRMFVCNPKAGTRAGKPFECNSVVWNGQAVTRDGRGIYLVTQTGYLYRLHADEDRLEALGSAYPESDRRVIKDEQYEYVEPRVFGIVLSHDEKHIYSVPTQQRRPVGAASNDPRARFGGLASYGFCDYNLETKTATRLARFSSDVVPGGWITGSNTCDSHGNVYFVAHDFRGYCALLKFQVSRD